MKSFRDPTDEWLKETIGEEANPMVTLLGKLTDVQFKFCEAYVKTGSPKKAADLADMPSSTNPALLVHLPKVAACINILTAKREQELGAKSSAEIVERLRNTSLVEEDDFSFSAGTVKEREEQLTVGSALDGKSDDALVENANNSNVPASHIMQLPKVKVPQAQVFGPQWIIERFVTVVERAMQIEPVFDRKGRPIGQFKFEPQAALKGLEMLGKTMAMFRDKVEVDHGFTAFTEGEIDDRIRSLVEEHPSLAKEVTQFLPKKDKKHEH